VFVHAVPKSSLSASSVFLIAPISMVKGVYFSSRNRKIGRTAIQADADLWVNQNCGDINTFHSRKVNVDVGGKLALID